MKTLNKAYEISDSPLYKLTTKRKLAALLLLEPVTLNALIKNTDNYNVFEQVNSNGKKRIIEHPNLELDKVHTRIASLLCRIKIPDFVHSGRAKHSHITNARIHIGHHKVLTTDIRSFFPSTSRTHLFNFFNRKMKCSSDVSDILSKICTYNEHLPTGSRISMPLALWANIGMFLELEKIAVKHDIKMSVYVDDITFSGDKLNKLFISTIKRIVERHGHIIHPVKTVLYAKDDAKVITGVILKDGKQFVKNEQHRNVYQDIEQWKILKDTPYMPETLKNRLLGRLNSLSAIEPKFKDKARSIRNHKTPTPY
ncbi:MAG: RNA-directed DNA polymerase [Alteromonadaceae bacterium]|nr:RNA-directed DNA polymerase [Alteromonadaceae bacterium]